MSEAKARVESERARDEALAEFERLCAAAQAESEKVRAPAWTAYERARDEALAEFERLYAPARAEFERLCNIAWADYERARDEARAKFKRVCNAARAAPLEQREATIHLQVSGSTMTQRRNCEKNGPAKGEKSE